jgi:hypothetical protein
MLFVTAAGFVPPRTSVLSSSIASLARALPAPEMHQMATRQGDDCLLSSISNLSNSICENATRLNRLDLERLGRRAQTACQFQHRLFDLKARIARMAAARARSADADSSSDSLLSELAG